MGDQGKRRPAQKGRTRQPTLSYLVGPGIPESGKQSAHTAPGEKPPAPQAAQTTASEPPAPESAAPEMVLNVDEQPTPPRLPIIPKEPPAAEPPGQQRPIVLAREQWMYPSTEETVEKFLSDIAEIAAPPVQERQESASPAFLPMPHVSSEAASRKKASATPFLSEMQAATPTTGTRPKRPRQRRSVLRRQRVIWAAAISGGLALIVLAAILAFVLLRR